MNLQLPARTSGLTVLVAVAILFPSCARDPHVRKQYLPSGKDYFGTHYGSPTNQAKGSGRPWKGLAFSERLLLVGVRVMMSS
jgi:hypothetical protein